MQLETDLAWVAGFMDGDGSISITTQNGKKPYPHIGIYQVKREPLEAVQSILGGKIHKNGQNEKAYGCKPMYAVAWRGWKECQRVAALLVPYLRVKKQQAELLLSLPQPKLGRGADNSTHRLALQRMRDLNA